MSANLLVFKSCCCADLPLQSAEKGKSKAKGKGRKRKASAKNEEEFEEESTPEPMGHGPPDEPAATSDAALPAGHPPQSSACDITSSNAYMLMYKRRAWQPQQGSPPAVIPIPERCTLFHENSSACGRQCKWLTSGCPWFAVLATLSTD